MNKNKVRELKWNLKKLRESILHFGKKKKKKKKKKNDWNAFHENWLHTHWYEKGGGHSISIESLWILREAVQYNIGPGSHNELVRFRLIRPI